MGWCGPAACSRPARTSDPSVLGDIPAVLHRHRDAEAAWEHSRMRKRAQAQRLTRILPKTGPTVVTRVGVSPG